MKRQLLAVAAILAATVPAFGTEIVTVPPSEAPVRWIVPAAGGELLGGSTVTLGWEPVEESPRAFEEWEVFLSLDGGHSYPIRLTPHLGSDLRRVSVQLPTVPSRDARLLMRLGNERQELAFEYGRRFTVVRPFFQPQEPLLQVADRGEPARSGDAGVVSWVEGDRHGAGWRTVHSRQEGDWSAVAPAASPTEWAEVTSPETKPSAPLGVASRSAVVTPPRVARPASLRCAPSARQILLSIQRQNE